MNEAQQARKRGQLQRSGGVDLTTDEARNKASIAEPIDGPLLECTCVQCTGDVTEDAWIE